MSEFNVNDIEHSELPRERMARLGAAALSDKELVAILIGSGNKQKTVFEIAEDLTRHGRLYRELCRVNRVVELTEENGLGPAKACLLLAAIELGRRIAKKGHSTDSVTVKHPSDIYELLSPDLRYAQEEHFYVLHLSPNNKVIAQTEITKGTLTGSLVHQREVFREAIIHHAAKIVVVHNHPSGDPSPSREDHTVTKMLRDAGEIMGIKLVDHVIIGDGNYYSFSDNGTI
ncbi:MAG: DNA repair protein RadC [Acidaminococcaceae bacterium]|nr:DNA repair protein RadC [Acidaminococcaceae bacterium]MDO4935255.1 DNA repair protein RadC [Phascolarctobacterium sp.]